MPSVYEDRGGTVTNYHSGIKNTFLQTNSAGSQTASKRYDAFGNVLASSGTWQGRFAYGGPHGYQTDASLQLLGDRYYDPSLGRFLTRDVAKDGRNWYVYCGDSPVSKADPSGNWTIWGYEFTLESVSQGLETGWGSVVDAFSFGAIGPGKLREAPGFDGASFFARTGRDLLLIAVFEGVMSWAGRGAAEAESAAEGELEGALNCFPAGTQVLMADGSSENIENIKPGEIVMSRSQTGNEKTSLSSGFVNCTSSHVASNTIRIQFENGSIVQCTNEHPFYVIGKGFEPANRLRAKDNIATSGRQGEAVISITSSSAPTRVFTLAVSWTHTYFVRCGDRWLWVHNLSSRPSKMNLDPTKPKGVRVDAADDNVPGSTDHVHYGKGPTWHNDGGIGRVGHTGRPGSAPADWPNAVKDWLEKHGWPRPR
jgi:RHS repeat-associated protein